MMYFVAILSAGAGIALAVVTTHLLRSRAEAKRHKERANLLRELRDELIRGNRLLQKAVETNSGVTVRMTAEELDAAKKTDL